MGTRDESPVAWSCRARKDSASSGRRDRARSEGSALGNASESGEHREVLSERYVVDGDHRGTNNGSNGMADGLAGSSHDSMCARRHCSSSRTTRDNHVRRLRQEDGLVLA